MKTFDEEGREIPDPTPVAIPLGFKRPESLEATMLRLMGRYSEVASSRGHETFEESQDFDVDEDPFPTSNHEYTEMQEEKLKEDVRGGVDEAKKMAHNRRTARPEQRDEGDFYEQRRSGYNGQRRGRQFGEESGRSRARGRRNGDRQHGEVDESHDQSEDQASDSSFD